MEHYYSPLKRQVVDYGDNPRSELVEFIKGPPDRILEIGCGRGAFGTLVKQKYPDAEYIGLELDEKAAEIARSRLDRVIMANIEEINLDQLGINKESFDFIICADVLEHLYDPWKVLFTLHAYLKPEGKILASIPNTQNISLILELLSGNWSYTEFGLLDATHIRFFTLNEIFKLFEGTGYKIINCASILQAQLEEDGWPRDLNFGNILLRQVTKEEAAKLYTFQYIVVAQKSEVY
jgi:2-polyprenyl-3-methyl-5-hydroxy-6-metoxy-1,4-benzoquinol methylase